MLGTTKEQSLFSFWLMTLEDFIGSVLRDS